MSGAGASSTIREGQNWLIHLLYLRREHGKCLDVIERELKECKGLCEYAIYVKGAGPRGGGAGRAGPPHAAGHDVRQA